MLLGKIAGNVLFCRLIIFLFLDEFSFYNIDLAYLNDIAGNVKYKTDIVQKGY
jgi:hypothetical protein